MHEIFRFFSSFRKTFKDRSSILMFIFEVSTSFSYTSSTYFSFTQTIPSSFLPFRRSICVQSGSVWLRRGRCELLASVPQTEGEEEMQLHRHRLSQYRHLPALRILRLSTGHRYIIFPFSSIFQILNFQVFHVILWNVPDSNRTIV